MLRLLKAKHGFSIIASIAASLLILFLFIPLVALFALANIGVLSEAWISDPVLAREAWLALIRTIQASLLSSFILLLVGIPSAYLFARKSFPLKTLIESIVDVPLMIPHAVAGIMVLVAYSRRGLLGFLTSGLGLAVDDSFWGIVAAMMFVSAPIAIDTIRVAIESIDPVLEMVARSLGASQFRVFMTITLPLSLRGIATGFILSWARSISEVGAILIVAYYPKTINVLVMEWFNTYGLSYAVALSIPLVLMSIALFIAVRLVLRK